MVRAVHIFRTVSPRMSPREHYGHTSNMCWRSLAHLPSTRTWAFLVLALAWWNILSVKISIHKAYKMELTHIWLRWQASYLSTGLPCLNLAQCKSLEVGGQWACYKSWHEHSVLDHTGINELPSVLQFYSFILLLIEPACRGGQVTNPKTNKQTNATQVMVCLF